MGENANMNEAPKSTAQKVDAVVHAYDIRGIVPSQLDEQVVRFLGKAFAAYLKAEDPATTKILCGRDMRKSGESLSQAFCSGVLEAGLGVVDLGLISSDLLYFATGDLNMPGAIFTASHNPSQYNGIKLCKAAAVSIGIGNGLEKVRELAVEFSVAGTDNSGSPDEQRTGDKKAEFEKLNFLDRYVEHMRNQIDFFNLAPFKVVVDAANGMGGLIVPAVFNGSPLDLDLMYGELDGEFPNHPPDPLNVENLQDLRKRVVEVGADIGLAFDGDADRVFLVDEKGDPLSGSTATALIAGYFLKRFPGEKIAYNLICSKSVPDTIQELGGIGIRTRVGHTYIKQVMTESGAIFAGEHSGHFYFRDNFGADSGMIGALKVLEQMSQSQKTLSQLKKPYEKYTTRGEINFEAPRPQEIIQEVAKRYAAYPQDELDGLTVDMGSSWFNLRPSNTEPFVRLNLEAESEEEFQQHFEGLKSVLKELMANI